MATATLHIAEAGGFAGPARCYRLDPPREFNGTDREFVIIWYTLPQRHIEGEVCVVPCDANAALAEPSIKRYAGSFTLDGNPSGDPAYIEGLHQWALASLGGYVITEPEPEPEPEGE